MKKIIYLTLITLLFLGCSNQSKKQEIQYNITMKKPEGFTNIQKFKKDQDTVVMFINHQTKSTLQIIISKSQEEKSDEELMGSFKKKWYIRGLKFSLKIIKKIQFGEWTKIIINNNPTWKTIFTGKMKDREISGAIFIFFKDKKFVQIIIQSPVQFFDETIKKIQDALETLKITEIN